MKKQIPVLTVDISKDEKMLDSTARFMFNVFNIKSGKYCAEFDKMLIAGGGGNSMFVNCWAKPSRSFIKTRISGEAKKKLTEYGYSSLNDAPNSFKYNNAKGAQNRIKAGKHLHLDHSPGNVKVLELIKEKCQSYDPDKFEYEQIIKEIKEFLKSIQTLDWITVEQDDIRTYADSNFTKKQKDKMNHQERDQLLNDSWDFLD